MHGQKVVVDEISIQLYIEGESLTKKTMGRSRVALLDDPCHR